MRVIFLQDVFRVAKSGEIKEVADGYGRNLLIPRNLALLASSSALTMAEAQKRIKEQKESANITELTQIAEMLEGKEVTVEARVGSKERLYGAITASDIASELEKATGIAVDKRKIELEEPIHQIGSYEIAIKLARDIVPKIKVTVKEKEKEAE
jgi:large subunit ribosomal protein L9